MTYRPKRAPKRRTYHRRWTSAHVVNSGRGAVLARDAGCRWIDNDFHLSKYGVAWVNAHGAPEIFWLPRRDRFEKHLAAELFKYKRVYRGRVWHLRNMHQTLVDNHHQGLSTEVEVKDVRPWDTPAILDAAFARLAWHAREVYGEHWREHVLVKVLTNLGGGEAYALAICAAAHAHEIPTMLLVRGRCRFHDYAGHEEVTWVRGSAVVR